jgi:hypothetical protein
MTKNNYHLSVNEKELKIILKGLGKLPFEQVYELIGSIVKQTATTPKQKITKSKVTKS